jgi:hypothetical protein
VGRIGEELGRIGEMGRCGFICFVVGILIGKFPLFVVQLQLLEFDFPVVILDFCGLIPV